jgi:glycosyltransferase involved in cell wall biosynthesis
MKAMFCCDGPLSRDQYGSYYGVALNERMFSRYYQITDSLTVAIRTEQIKSDGIINGLSKINLNNFQVVPCPNLSSLKGMLLNRFKLENILYDQIKNVDFLIIRLPSLIGSLSADIARKMNKPYLIELVGCPWDAYWNHSWKGKLVAPFMWYATKKAVKNAPYVLYVSSNFLQKRYPNNFNNISCSDVDLQPVKQDVLDQRLEKIKNMNKNKPLVLCTIANVDVKYKRQDLVIKAISELNIQGYNFEYRLVGGGNTNHLQSIAEKYGVVDKVIFEGSVPHEKVFDYLDDIDIYIQPSDAESHGRVILEAMSRGCPCIGSSTGGIPELIDASFIFKRRNVNELIDILAGFDKEKMIKQAKRNFEFSKGYAKKVLEARRNEFLLSFKKYADQDLQGENK